MPKFNFEQSLEPIKLESEDLITEGNIDFETENLEKAHGLPIAKTIIEAMAPYMDDKILVRFLKMSKDNAGYCSRLKPEFKGPEDRDAVTINPDYDQSQMHLGMIHEIGHAFEGKLESIARDNDLEILPQPGQREQDNDFFENGGFEEGENYEGFYGDLIPMYIFYPEKLREFEHLPMVKDSIVAIEKMFEDDNFEGMRITLKTQIAEFKAYLETEHQTAAAGEYGEEELEDMKPVWLKEDYKDEPFIFRVLGKIEEFHKRAGN